MKELTYSYLKANKINGELPKEFLKKKCIVRTYFNQYAEGITGVNRSMEAFINDNEEGFKNALEAKEKMIELGWKNINRKGKKTPYGNIGALVEKYKVMTIEKFLEEKKRFYNF